MGKRAEYLVTPAKGRVGKARQVQPFAVKVGERHGDIDYLEEQISFALRKHAHKNDLDTFVYTTGTAGVYTATVWSGETQIATLAVEAIEKES